jgi:hypothetical protein
MLHGATLAKCEHMKKFDEGNARDPGKNGPRSSAAGAGVTSPAQIPPIAVGRMKPFAAEIQIHARHLPRPGRTAGARQGFEDQGGQSTASEPARGTDTGGACTNDDDVGFMVHSARLWREGTFFATRPDDFHERIAALAAGRSAQTRRAESARRRSRPTSRRRNFERAWASHPLL